MVSKTFGERLSALRKLDGFTQQELADKLNVSNKTVSRWERDECAPDISLLPKIADIFHVSCDELLRNDYNEPTKNKLGVMHTDKPFEERILNCQIFIWISMLIACIGFLSMVVAAYTFRTDYVNVLSVFCMLIVEVASFVITCICVNKLKLARRNNINFSREEDAVKDKYHFLLSVLAFCSFAINIVAVYLAIIKILIAVILTGGTEPAWSFLIASVLFTAILTPFIKPIHRMYVKKLKID